MLLHWLDKVRFCICKNNEILYFLSIEFCYCFIKTELKPLRIFAVEEPPFCEE